MKTRRLVPELMDEPGLDPIKHRQALRGLRRINLFSGTARVIARSIAAQASERELRSASILDLGCGSGDVACSVLKALPSFISWQMEGWDISPTAIEYAQATAMEWKRVESLRANHPDNSLSFWRYDIASPPNKTFDFVYCSLFLHHFGDKEAIEVLRRMKSLARHALFVDDLDRTQWGWLLAKVGVRILSRSPIVHFDGPQSVRAAFGDAEVARLATAAGLDRFRVTRHWPQRWLLTAEVN